MSRSAIFLSVCLLTALVARVTSAQDSRQSEFADKIAPILAAHCQKCHAAEKPKSGLDLTSMQSLARGGESGPAIVASHADKSLLLQAIRDGLMPPEGENQLNDHQIELIRDWINSLTEAEVSAGPVRSHDGIETSMRAFWAFQKLLPNPPVPYTSHAQATRTPVDAFIIDKLEKHQLLLAPEADRPTLLRRASYDLLGLPPSPEALEAFLKDERADAYEQMVERLLASPHFGERWGRHWLDGAGYADITGGDNDAGIIKLSDGKWKYRDYVVRAFNEDMPYDQFLLEQLAGDELVDWRSAPSFTPEIQDRLIATGFLRSAADDTDEKELTTPDILHGVLQRTSEVVVNDLLGLTLGCAKCHDHKYEPIPQQDYYRLLAAFTPVFNPQSWVPPKQRALADISPTEKAQAEQHNAELDRQITELKKSQAELRHPHEERLFESKLSGLPEPIRADVKTALQTAADKRSEVQRYLVDKFKATLQVKIDEVHSVLSPMEVAQLAERDQKIVALNQTRRTWGTIQAAYDVGPPPPTYLLRRGNHETPGPTVEPGFVTVLFEKDPSPLVPPTTLASQRQALGPTSGRRLALAQWLTDWDSPAGGLAARVMVNRVWQHLFGRGIVETSENLGISGARPSHPELLEWLSRRFIFEGRQVKPLIKLLMTSAVYRQSSHRAESSRQSASALSSNPDPGNHLLAHMPLRRVEAEIVRDSILAVSGTLDPSLGGPPVSLETRSDGMVVIQDKGLASASAKTRRSLYVLARRNYHLSMLNVFDQPAMSTNCPHRQQSAVVLQSLTMLNDEFVLDQADRFARRVAAASGNAPRAQHIKLAFRIALGRHPSTREAAWSEALLAEHEAEYREANLPADQIAQKSLAQLCHMLLNSNEFLYIP